jgi:thioredoxin 1
MSKNGIVILTDENFYNEVVESSLPVLIEHGANWPTPIELLVLETLKELAIEFEGQIKVARLDMNESSYSVSEFNLWKFPCILIFMGGRVVDKTSIAVQKAVLADKLRRLLNLQETPDSPLIETKRVRDEGWH